MQLRGVHFLLTYTCLQECDHCFVWGSPKQSGTMTRAQVRDVLEQAKRLRSVEWIYFEGGEPFLFYALLLDGIRRASQLGFRVGVVSNAYWATDVVDARAALEPMAGLVQDLSVSSDPFHGDEDGLGERARNAREAAASLGIPADVIHIAAPECGAPSASRGQLPLGKSQVMFRGRAAETLASKAPLRRWDTFEDCPHEELLRPERLHVDAFGHAHVCQGISLGNVFHGGLERLCAGYDASQHPIVGPLVDGGPAELARRYGVQVAEAYADACHLCDATRHALRQRFPQVLAPDAMYGVTES